MIAQLLAALPVAGSFGAAPVEKRTDKIPETTVTFDMIKCPAGEIEMKIGTETVKRQIKPFWIGKTEVTWDEFDIFAYGLDIKDEKEKIEAISVTRPSKPYGAPDFGFGHSQYPCLAETYFSAETYCKWLSDKTGKKYRLPTEAEWEYACRAGGAPVKPEADALLEMAWVEENAEEKTHPVAQKKPNEWGLYDTLGNALEWVLKDEAGLAQDKKYDEENPDKPKKRADTQLARGGSWAQAAEKVNSGARFYQTPSWNVTDPQNPKSRWWLSDGKFISFRVVCEE
jgi:formylglycine-generating enzyme required for sulfatase activity